MGRLKNAVLPAILDVRDFGTSASSRSHSVQNHEHLRELEPLAPFSQRPVTTSDPRKEPRITDMTSESHNIEKTYTWRAHVQVTWQYKMELHSHRRGRSTVRHSLSLLGWRGSRIHDYC